MNFQGQAGTDGEVKSEGETSQYVAANAKVISIKNVEQDYPWDFHQESELMQHSQIIK